MRRAQVLIAVLLASFAALSTRAAGASYHVYICGGWSNNQGPLVPATSPGMLASVFSCGSGTVALIELQGPSTTVPNGTSASWTATAPAGLTITHIYTVSDGSTNVGNGQGWWGEFFWNGGPRPAGRSAQITPTFSTNGCCQASFNDRTVGWFIACGWPSCSNYANGLSISVQ